MSPSNSVHPCSPAHALAEKVTLFLSLAMFVLLALLWSLAFFTIGSLGTRHLWVHFGAEGFGLIIFVALAALFVTQVAELAKRALATA